MWILNAIKALFLNGYLPLFVLPDKLFVLQVLFLSFFFYLQLDVEFDASAAIIDNIKTEALQEMETNISAFKTTTGNSAVEYSGNMGFSHNNFGDDAFSVGSTVNQLDNLSNRFEESSSYTNAVGSSDITGPVIKRRTRQPQIQSDANNCGPQGTARRRIRLQTKLEVRHACSMSRDLNCKEEAEVRSLPREPNYENSNDKFLGSEAYPIVMCRWDKLHKAILVVPLMRTRKLKSRKLIKN